MVMSHLASPWTLLAFAVLPVCHGWAQALEVGAPAFVSPRASIPVDHTYASFSFPAHWFADFRGQSRNPYLRDSDKSSGGCMILICDAGNLSQPNLFSRDVFDLLRRKTGAAPFIRVGGTSA